MSTTTTQPAKTDHAGRARALLERADEVLAPTYRRPGTLFVDGDGAWLRDAAGREYLDMTSGIAVLALGHRSAVVREALLQAAEKLVHVSNLYHTAPPIELAARLVELSFADSVFFANSGTEAVEAAVKFARLATGRAKILHFEGSFHGRTLGALAATDRPDYQDPFRPLPGGFERAPWNDEAALDHVDDDTAVVLLEPIQGEMGVRAADPAWVRAIRRRCDEVGALLAFDEIQCGLGRTGRLWAHEAFGVAPDLLTLAKPLAGGLPIGAVLMTRRVAGTLSPGVHGTTFGGGPLVTAVARAVLDHVSRQDVLARVRELGEHLERRLLRLEPRPDVEETRGTGLMRGVRVTVPVKDVVDAAFRRGLLIVPSADGVVRILPPLEVKPEELDLCVERLTAALDEVTAAVAS